MLAESSQLNELDLSETSVGNEVFAILGKTPGLQRLNLFGTAVDVNAEITPGSFANLRQLFVANTAADVAALDVALPHVDVIGDLGLAPPEAVEEEDQSSD